MTLDYRCPRCGKLYPLAAYTCWGGWQTYPIPDEPRAAAHPPTDVVARQ